MRIETYDLGMSVYADPLVVLRFPPPLTMTQSRFFDFCIANPEVKMELTAKGEVVIVPTGWNTGKRNAAVVHQMTHWALATDLGTVVGPDRDSICRTEQRALQTPPLSAKNG